MTIIHFLYYLRIQPVEQTGQNVQASAENTTSNWIWALSMFSIPVLVQAISEDASNGFLHQSG